MAVACRHQSLLATWTMTRSIVVFYFLTAIVLEGHSMVESLTPTDDRNDSATSSSSYGVDVSFPMHHEQVSVNFDYLPHNALPSLYPTPVSYRGMPIQALGDRQEVYNRYLKGCQVRYSDQSCRDYERDRVAMNIRQPQSMINYTVSGFQKLDVPQDVWGLIRRFWERNKENWKPERWPEGNTFVNHWEAPTYLVNIEDSSLRGGGTKLKQSILDGTRESIRSWSSCEELTDCSLYGIRVYTEGAMLNSHVDRLPLVFSAVINVAQDLDQPWPMEVIGHDGKAHNVTLTPGEMLIYESHSVIHGRPFELKGRFAAHLFVHFEPAGHSIKHHDHDNGSTDQDVASQYRKAVEEGTGGHEAEGSVSGLPPYLLPNSPEEPIFRQEHPDLNSSNGDEQTLAHYLAAEGKTNDLIELIEEQKHLVHSKDSNGWTPLHEGARWGHVDVVKYLVQKGADIHERSRNGTGGNAMYYAQSVQGPDSPVALFLESIGASSVEPDSEL